LASSPEQLPPAALSGNPAVFSAYLADTGQPFLLLGGLQEQRAQVRFTGPFEGAEVVWDCQFLALGAQRQRDAPGLPAATGSRRNFIEIGEPGARGVALRVGLDLARIDRPAILKMIVMIRNYKRLRRGRHEFGTA